MRPTWDPYFLRRGSRFSSFWKDYLGERERNLLFIVGLGFDPRASYGVESILAAGGGGKRDCLLLEYDEGEGSPSERYRELVDRNRESLIAAIGEHGEIIHSTIEMWTGHAAGRRRIGPRRAADQFPSVSRLRAYDDVVIDVSAMPVGVFFPLLGKGIAVLQEARGASTSDLPNLFAMVAENAAIDRGIVDVGPDDTAAFIHGFGSDLDMEATAEIPRIWIPVVGETQIETMRRIYDLVNPDEICPVLPNPSRDPRRGDQLLVEYRQVLFDEWRVDPTNIIYASESNPFEVYRQVLHTATRYHEALQALGGCKLALSSVSSKLISLGTMLAAFDLKRNGFGTGLAHVGVQGYDLSAEVLEGTELDQSDLYALGLFGDFYEQ